MNETEINIITEKIIGAAYTVSNTLGAGFLEKVYENALRIELRKIGLNVEQQYPVTVYYYNEIVGEYYTDLYVNNEIIIELKSVKNIEEIHKAQLLNYLKATGKKYGLLINFGNAKIDVKRLVYGY